MSWNCWQFLAFSPDKCLHQVCKCNMFLSSPLGFSLQRDMTMWRAFGGLKKLNNRCHISSACWILTNIISLRYEHACSLYILDTKYCNSLYEDWSLCIFIHIWDLLNRKDKMKQTQKQDGRDEREIHSVVLMPMKVW